MVVGMEGAPFGWVRRGYQWLAHGMETSPSARRSGRQRPYTDGGGEIRRVRETRAMHEDSVG